LPPLFTSLELRPPEPEVVSGVWRALWEHVVGPFRTVAPEGMAELMLVLAVASLVALLVRPYGLRRLVYLSLLAIWALLLFSLVLYWFGL